MRSLFWFRRDLRLEDNTGLYYALQENNEVIPVFIFETDFFYSSDTGAAKTNFLCDCIKAFGKQLNEINSKLIIRKGEPASELSKLASETNAKCLYFNRAYEPGEIIRDEKVIKIFDNSGCKVKTYKDYVIFEEKDLFKKNRVITISFSNYKKRWLKKLNETELLLFTPSERDKKKFIETDWEVISLKSPEPQDYNLLVEGTYPKGGESEARKLLSEFFKDTEMRSGDIGSPIFDSISRFSPYLRSGNLSPVLFLSKAKKNLNSDSLEIREIAKSWVEKMIVRDYYIQKLLDQSEFKEQIEDKIDIRWSQTYQHFFTWCNAQTGFPIIDASMNQLNTEGILPDKLREITALFLIKILNVDEKWGEKYYMHKLVDGELALNSGLWTQIKQLSGKVKFNPEVESKNIDKTGKYIKKYLPKLNKVPELYIHAPYKMPTSLQKKLGCIIGVDYPEPIIKISQYDVEHIRLLPPKESS